MPDRPRCAEAPLAFAVLALGVALAAPAARAQESAPIQDNSFLIEEAYNQEAGVVQHISAYSRERDGGGWVYTFTQEWPIGSQRHQLSYTLPVLGVRDGSLREDGLGDVLLNYRYQAAGDGDAAVAFAPRISLIVPTGDEPKGLGTGALGAQANLPLSVVLAPQLVSHVNLGLTWLPGSKNPAGDEADLTLWSFGQSFVWLARPRFNALVELTYLAGQTIVGPETTADEQALFVNPGIRWAHDLRSGLQIVPGVAYTIGLGPSSGTQAVFAYLSFEHPFRK